MSAVVYARVPEALKQVVQRHALERGLTLTGAVVELLERGVESIAAGRSVAELERKLALAASERERAEARVREAGLRLRAAGERERIIARVYAAVSERARQQLARCPRCREPVRGSDLFVSGRCPQADCGAELTSLLTPAPRAGMDSTQYVALTGALGVLVGLAVASSDDADAA